MKEIKVIIQTQKEYEQEKLKNYESQKRYFKFIWRFIVKNILAGFTALMFGSLFQSYAIGVYTFQIMIILYIIDIFSTNRKLISYLRAFFGITYLSISLMFTSALIYGIINKINIINALFGSIIAIGLFGYMGRRNIVKYTNLFKKKSEKRKFKGRKRKERK